jgi:hypothetical protein
MQAFWRLPSPSLSLPPDRKAYKEGLSKIVSQSSLLTTDGAAPCIDNSVINLGEQIGGMHRPKASGHSPRRDRLRPRESEHRGFSYRQFE